jgi:hypothetical protein
MSDALQITKEDIDRIGQRYEIADEHKKKMPEILDQVNAVINENLVIKKSPDYDCIKEALMGWWNNDTYLRNLANQRTKVQAPNIHLISPPRQFLSALREGKKMLHDAIDARGSVASEAAGMYDTYGSIISVFTYVYTTTPNLPFYKPEPEDKSYLWLRDAIILKTRNSDLSILSEFADDQNLALGMPKKLFASAANIMVSSFFTKFLPTEHESAIIPHLLEACKAGALEIGCRYGPEKTDIYVLVYPKEFSIAPSSTPHLSALHNLQGPAVVWADDTKDYCLNGFVRVAQKETFELYRKIGASKPAYQLHVQAKEKEACALPEKLVAGFKPWDFSIDKAIQWYKKKSKKNSPEINR